MFNVLECFEWLVSFNSFRSYYVQSILKGEFVGEPSNMVAQTLKLGIHLLSGGNKDIQKVITIKILLHNKNIVLRH